MSKRENRDKKKMRKSALVLILLGLIILSAGILVNFVFNNTDEVVEEEEDVVEEIIEDEVELKYALPKSPTKYQETLNTEINDLVETEGYDTKTLAELVAKNFIAEYYTLSNTTSNTPGGLQYVPKELQSRFEDFASKIYDFYNYYDNRDKLSVKDIVITTSKSITYTYSDDLGAIKTKKDLKGYDVTMSWSYENGDNATTKVKVVLWNSDYGVVSLQN